MYQVNQLSESLLGTRLLPYHHAPTQHNHGEFFGVEYLYVQAGLPFSYTPVSSDDEIEMDEGFVDQSMTASSISEDVLTVGAGAPGEEEEDTETETENEDEVCAMHILMIII